MCAFVDVVTAIYVNVVQHEFILDKRSKPGPIWPVFLNSTQFSWVFLRFSQFSQLFAVDHWISGILVIRIVVLWSCNMIVLQPSHPPSTLIHRYYLLHPHQPCSELSRFLHWTTFCWPTSPQKLSAYLGAFGPFHLNIFTYFWWNCGPRTSSKPPKWCNETNPNANT